MKEKVGICVIAIVLTYVVWFVVLAMQPSKVERFNYSRRVFPSIFQYGPYVYGKDDKIIWDSLPFKKVKPKIESILDSLAKEQNNSDEDIMNWANPKK